MKALLAHHNLGDALKTLDASASDADKTKKIEQLEKAHNMIIVCLGDKVLREVTREKNIVDVWARLDSLYLTKSISN